MACVIHFAPALHLNGPVVDLVAVCVRAGEFFAGPDRWYGVVMSR
jgi:hypothetical protein